MYTANMQANDVIKMTNSNVETGLSNEEVIKRQGLGKNELSGKKPKSLFVRIFELLNEPMTYILIAAAIISVIAHGFKDFTDAFIILVVVIMNTGIGLFQEGKAEKALQSLKNLSSPQTLVLRSGTLLEIDVKELVVGDIVILEAGRYIPADLHLIEAINLAIDESILTGESVAVEKNTQAIQGDPVGIGDQKNCAFMSTYATYGRGKAVVTAIGMDTEIGHIASLLEQEETLQTPLQQKLVEISKLLAIASIALTVIMFVIGILQNNDWIEMLLTSIALAVAVIPEGLTAVVTIVLALGVQRMIKNHAIVKKLPAVETLGSVDVICSDKTGTITQNKMTVTQYFINDQLRPINQFNLEEDQLLVKGLMLCSDAINENNRIGDPTELALVDLDQYIKLKKSDLELKYPRIEERPFDSDRKMMSTVHQDGARQIVFTKGAMDQILKHCIGILIDGEVKPLADYQKNLIAASKKMSHDALRVLGLAYKEKDQSELESNLIFVGLVGMIDPPRDEVIHAVKQCEEAGIKTVMITGDHPDTAKAIAQQVGMITEHDLILTGQELSMIKQSELNQVIDRYRVFARVQPEHKVMIVKALQAQGKIVSMTGDGVNDAPSLKVANIGVAMGITGSDVSKEAASMILTDDNFATIVKAVEEGRNIFNNIKKTIYYLLSCNIGEVTALFVAIALGWPAPLTPIHILWVNLVTDSLPALALGVDPGDPDVMKEMPRPKNESLFAHGGGAYLLFNGLLVGTLTLLAFQYGSAKYGNGSNYAQTMAFMTLSIAQLFHAFNTRDFTKSIFQIGLFKNIWLVFAVLIGLILQMSVAIFPFLSRIFETTALTFDDWVVVFGLSSVMVILNEVFKYFKRRQRVLKRP